MAQLRVAPGIVLPTQPLRSGPLMVHLRTLQSSRHWLNETKTECISVHSTCHKAGSWYSCVGFRIMILVDHLKE